MPRHLSDAHEWINEIPTVSCEPTSKRTARLLWGERSPRWAWLLLWGVEKVGCYANNGCLGSYIDEERSEMRYVMRIAKPSSHQNFERTLHFLRGVCLLECLYIPTTNYPFVQTIAFSKRNVHWDEKPIVNSADLDPCGWAADGRYDSDLNIHRVDCLL